MAYKAKNISYQALCKTSLLTLPYQRLRLVLEAITGGPHTFQDPLSCEAETRVFYTLVTPAPSSLVHIVGTQLIFEGRIAG